MLEFNCQLRTPQGFQLDLSFTAARVVTALFGPSGSGKTTVLELIAGLRQPTAGLITLDDRDLLNSAQRINLRPEHRRIGVVFQDHALFPHLTVAGNLRFGNRRGQTRAIGFDRVVEVLELGGKLDRRPHELSGGEKQRVALGRALLSGPDLLLLDEPLAALDEPLKMRVLAYLERVVAEWRIPTLFVSHSSAEVRRFAEWAIVLAHGRAAANGPPEEALGLPAVLGDDAVPPTNLLRLDRVEATGGAANPGGEKTDCKSVLPWRGWIGDQSVWLPPSAGSDGAENAPPTFVQFSPAAVLLSRQPAPHTSARNQLRGIVRQMVALPGRTFVAVDVGQIIWAAITPESAADLGLATGGEVICIIKTQSLAFLE